MGMAASQVRLLSLTSRLHNIELKAQNVESQKIALATQKDELYQEYMEALDAKKIQVAFVGDDGNKFFVDANFSTVCLYNENRARQYSLKDTRTGRLIVTSDVAENYKEYSNDPYAFAFAMLGFTGNDWSYSSGDLTSCFGELLGFNPSNKNYNLRNELITAGLEPDDYIVKDPNGKEYIFMTDVEKIVYDKIKGDHPDLEETYNNLVAAVQDGNMTEAGSLYNEFRDSLYKYGGKDIYDEMRVNKNFNYNYEPEKIYNEKYPEGFPQQEFNYYVTLFKQIQDCGGCQEIPDAYLSGEEGNTWFNNMVSAGLVVISQYDCDKHEWDETSVATSTNQNLLIETQDDKDLKKAEAKYEHELSEVNSKDTKFDQELSKLESERTSITTEIDAIKQVRNDNIERSFGIFS